MEREGKAEQEQKAGSCAQQAAAAVCTDEFGVWMTAALEGIDAGSDEAAHRGNSHSARAQGDEVSISNRRCALPSEERPAATVAGACCRVCSSYNLIVKVFFA